MEKGFMKASDIAEELDISKLTRHGQGKNYAGKQQ